MAPEVILAMDEGMYDGKVSQLTDVGWNIGIHAMWFQFLVVMRAGQECGSLYSYLTTTILTCTHTVHTGGCMVNRNHMY